MTSLRILHVGTAGVPVLSDRGGALQRRMLEMAELQLAAGNEVVILSPGTRDRTIDRVGVTIHELALRSRHPLRTYEFLARGRRKLAGAEGFDVLHAHGSPWAARTLNSARAKVQSVDYFKYGGSNRESVRRGYIWALQGFDAILPVSEYCAREFVSFYPELRDKVTILPNGVNTSQFSPDGAAAARARSELGLPSDREIVLYLGRVCEQKGSDLLASLASSLRDEAPHALVVAAGPPETFGTEGTSPLMRTLQDAGVMCTGAVHEDLVAGLLTSAAVFVLPTRRDEMFGMAALEAASAGSAVVASQLGGIPEAVGPGGVLFPVGDAEGFADAVVKLLDEPSYASSLASKGRSHAATYSWPRIVEQSNAIYRRVLDER